MPCYDICNSTLFDHTHPGVKTSTAGQRVAYEKEKCGALEDVIDKWRDAMLKRDVPEPYFTPRTSYPMKLSPNSPLCSSPVMLEHIKLLGAAMDLVVEVW